MTDFRYPLNTVHPYFSHSAKAAKLPDQKQLTLVSLQRQTQLRVALSSHFKGELEASGNFALSTWFWYRPKTVLKEIKLGVVTWLKTGGTLVLQEPGPGFNHFQSQVFSTTSQMTTLTPGVASANPENCPEDQLQPSLPNELLKWGKVYYLPAFFSADLTMTRWLEHQQPFRAARWCEVGNQLLEQWDGWDAEAQATTQQALVCWVPKSFWKEEIQLLC